MAIRDNIVEMAIWEANYGQWRPEADEMVRFFEECNLDPPTDDDLTKFATMQSNVPVNGASTAWCGIFACYVLKRWGGLDVHWEYGTGIVGDVKKVWDYRYMRPGDVAVIRNKAYVDKHGQTNYLHHHYIVTEISYDENTHSLVEGNGNNNKIWWRSDRAINQSPASSNSLKRPYAYYQLVA